ncbi:caspase family protein [Streptomyces sp. NPDC020983]|uniref:caspase, EACC1-associated type n=1 Tax=Streptomyces sp. NPDC020983 TaxID=3365106 RepID=UPI0037A3308C
MPLQPPDKASSRAVFLGTTEYHPSTRLQQLANVESSIRRLRHLLCERVEAVFDDELCPAPLLNPARSHVALEALESAAREADDVLLVYYGGHAIPSSQGNEDQLYLVLSEAVHPHTEADSLDFGRVRAVLRKARARVRILILDCCYSGIAARGVLSGGSAPLTTEQLQRMTLEEGWHIVTSAAADETAADSDGHGYTAFTGALIDGLEQGVDPAPDGAEPAYLGIDSLFGYVRHRLPEQGPQILQNGGSDVALGPNPRRLPVEYEQWADAVEDFLRSLVPAAVYPDGHDDVVDLARRLVLRLARSYQSEPRLANDPWRSAGFAVRMCEHLTHMVKRAGPRGPRLSQAEALLVALMPFVYATWWDGALGELLKSTDPERDLLPSRAAPDTARGSYQEFLGRRPDAVRRARAAVRRGNGTAARAIWWWLFRHWALERAFIERSPDPLRTVCALMAEADGPSRDLTRLLGLYGRMTLQHVLDPLLRALLASPDPRLRSDKPPATDTVIRTGLIARFLTVAQQMAVDPFVLPTAIDHVNAGSGFTPEMFRERFWTWRPLSRDGAGTVGYDLDAECGSPQAASVLRAHAAALDHYVLQLAHPDNGLSGTADLGDLVPLRYSSLGVLPKLDDRHRPLFSLTEMRLTLDDDSIRELLMGRQIYHHPEAAIRELFQNALDACRHRDRRLAFLRHKRGGAPTGSWRGQIGFVRGTDENGRPFIECSDNGVGMGEHELEKLFARGGKRFTRSQEYLEEQAEWRHAGISMQPNSIFGIGVYSYFLLAEEIRVVTRRFNRDGELGSGLRVDITGPGALFHISNMPGIEAGTTVRLYLKQDLDLPPLDDVLARWIWTSDYDLEAREEGVDDVFRLPAGRLGGPVSRSGGTPVATEGAPAVWWCSGEGGVLRDGIWISLPLFGAVVNLTGPDAPELTIDRNQPRNPEAVAVDGLLTGRLDSLVRTADGPLTPAWLVELARERPAVADAVLEAAIESGLPSWRLGDQEADIAVVGCFPPEYALWARSVTADAGKRQDKQAKDDRDHRVLRQADSVLASLPDTVADWRLRAWAKAGLIPGVRFTASEAVPVARPSDALLTDPENLEALAPGEDEETLRSLSVRVRRRGQVPSALVRLAAAAERLGTPISSLVARLRLLGGDTAGFRGIPDHLTRDDAELLGHYRVAVRWPDSQATVPMGYILATAREKEMPPAQIRERLEQLGCRTPAAGCVPRSAVVQDGDLLLLSARADGALPWLDPDAEVPLGHVLVIAARQETTPQRVAGRLTDFGFRVPDGAAEHPAWQTVLGNEDRILLSRDMDGVAPWLATRTEVTAEQLLAAAAAAGSTLRQACERALLLGWGVPADAGSHPAWEVLLEQGDRRLLSRELDDMPPWIPSGSRVPIGHLLAVCESVEAPPRPRVAERFAQLGYVVDERDRGTRSPETLKDDLVVLSTGLNGEGPWLDPLDPVPAGHVLCAARATGYTAKDVVARLIRLGHRVPAFAPHTFRTATRDADLIILSEGLDGERPWLPVAADVSFPHLLAAAAATASSPQQVAERLSRFGHRIEESASAGTAWRALLKRTDLVMVSRDLDGKTPWLETGEPVSVEHLVAAGANAGRTPRQVAERLAELGFTIADTAAAHPAWQVVLSRSDLALVEHTNGRQSPQFQLAGQVPLRRVLSLAARTAQEPWQVWERLEQLGYEPTPGVEFPRRDGSGGAGRRAARDGNNSVAERSPGH